MKTSNHIINLIIGLTLFTCNYPQKENKTDFVDTATIDKNESSNETFESKITSDTLYKLLDSSIQLDTFEFSNWTPFLFLKTGNFLSALEKNAILVTCPTDSTYKVEYYSKSGDKWVKNDELDLPDALPIQFYLDFDDYNFDGQKDIYLQCSSSNGYALSRGHLLTINSRTKKIQAHPETRELANMQADFESKTVISEEVIWSVDYGFQGVCDLKNKWIDGKLKTVKKECPSKNPKGNQ